MRSSSFKGICPGALPAAFQKLHKAMVFAVRYNQFDNRLNHLSRYLIGHHLRRRHPASSVPRAAALHSGQRISPADLEEAMTFQGILIPENSSCHALSGTIKLGELP
jgi:hypothetical protein